MKLSFLRVAGFLALFTLLFGPFFQPVADADGAIRTLTLPPGCWEIERAVVGLDEDGSGSLQVPALSGDIELAILTWAGSDDLSPQNISGGDRGDSDLTINGVTVRGTQLEGDLGYAQFPQNDWFVWEADVRNLISSGGTLSISGWDANWVNTEDSDRNDHTNGAMLSVVTDTSPCAEPVSVDVYQGLDYVHHAIDNSGQADDYTEAIVFPMTNMPVEQIIEVPIFFAGTEHGVDCRGLDMWGVSGTDADFPASSGSPNYNVDFDIFENQNQGARILNGVAINNAACSPGWSGRGPGFPRGVSAETIGLGDDVSGVLAQIALPPNQDWLALQMESVASNNGESGAWVLAALVNRARPDALGDTVWFDRNRNCAQDPDEPGFPGATARLQPDPSRSIPIPPPRTTDADGYYVFENLPIGTHQVTFELPAGYTFTEANCAAADDLTDSDAIPVSARVSEPIPGTIDGITGDLTIDAGVVAPVDVELTKRVAPSAGGPFDDDLAAQIGDTVYFQVTVRLVDEHPAGYPYSPLDAVTVSDVLPVGLSFVSATPSAGTFEPTTGSWEVGSLDPGQSQTLVIAATVDAEGFLTNRASVERHDHMGSAVTDVDSTPGNGPGEDDDDAATVRVGTGTIGDFVWLDSDGDGCQTPGEPGVPGIPVNLRLNGTVVATTTSNAAGVYLFDALPAGDYQVSFGSTAGTDPTTGICADSARNSDGTVVGVSLFAGQSDLTIDHGVVEVDIPETLAFSGLSSGDLALIAGLTVLAGGLLAAGTTRRAWNLDAE